MEGVASKDSSLEREFVDWRGEGKEEGMLKGRGRRWHLLSFFPPDPCPKVASSSSGASRS